MGAPLGEVPTDSRAVCLGSTMFGGLEPDLRLGGAGGTDSLRTGGLNDEFAMFVSVVYLFRPRSGSGRGEESLTFLRVSSFHNKTSSALGGNYVVVAVADDQR
mmetsp:Transcript_11996/g.29039  ORF Transcript_11996/g.29039 Transcript_11996/m.29039 type:complete len:103 (+) Transcript_11996:104-412(+)